MCCDKVLNTVGQDSMAIDTEIAKMRFFLFYISPECEDMEMRSLLNDVDRERDDSITN